ncbi:helix-turn-helix domain-containing protein [Corynebacterium spheniscorum]|uniref:Transposase and inactivated derivatives n=1 Tax=Corynebacterium spheniscorum TaxID=185761 RepID=A0A1I2V7U3_9CORY|nr:helix-turn-helix domain-containing protein [Corynebacterium spheniscorum]SFG85435.1 Transposase and inactivated derivatives [Corynebacterium spheniscorum]
MEKPNQPYSFDVKKEVVSRHLEGETPSTLAKEFGLASSRLVDAWVIAWRRGGDETLQPKATLPPRSEIGELRRRLEKLEADNAYLKALYELSRRS